jgi:hypothetical protein
MSKGRFSYGLESKDEGTESERGLVAGAAEGSAMLRLGGRMVAQTR